MISRFAILLLLSGSVICRVLADSPETLADVIYHEVYRGTYAPGEEATALRGDGTALSYLRLLASRVTSPTQPGGEGTYTYAKTGPATAELSITDEGGNRVARTLTFLTASSGTWAGQAPVPDATEQTFSLRPLYPNFPLMNSSSRTGVASDRRSIFGFVVTGLTRRVLVRAVGPGLQSFGVSPAAEAPVLEIFASDGTRLATDTGWDENPADRIPLAPVFRLVGAFPLAAGSADAALLVQLQPGTYTAHVSTAGSAGDALTEVYVLP